jgi:hypothetical protein
VPEPCPTRKLIDDAVSVLLTQSFDGAVLTARLAKTCIGPDVDQIVGKATVRIAQRKSQPRSSARSEGTATRISPRAQVNYRELQPVRWPTPLAVAGRPAPGDRCRTPQERSSRCLPTTRRMRGPPRPDVVARPGLGDAVDTYCRPTSPAAHWLLPPRPPPGRHRHWHGSATSRPGGRCRRQPPSVLWRAQRPQE